MRPNLLLIGKWFTALIYLNTLLEFSNLFHKKEVFVSLNVQIESNHYLIEEEQVYWMTDGMSYVPCQSLMPRLPPRAAAGWMVGMVPSPRSSFYLFFEDLQLKFVR